MRNFSLTDKPILMKLCTVAVYTPRKFKKDNLGVNYFKGDYYKCMTEGMLSDLF